MVPVANLYNLLACVGLTYFLELHEDGQYTPYIGIQVYVYVEGELVSLVSMYMYSGGLRVIWHCIYIYKNDIYMPYAYNNIYIVSATSDKVYYTSVSASQLPYRFLP